jgi:hypothetical protein
MIKSMMGVTLLALAACSHSGNSGTSDTAAVTPSVSGTVSAVAGAGKHVLSLSFNSSDGRALKGLSVTSGLTSMPTGWSGPSTFSCPTADSGSGCVLTLTYAPTTSGSGTLTLKYSYQDNAGADESGSVAIPYAATAANNIVATASPSGQINAVAGAGAQAVALTFTTDDGTAATALTLTTAINSLPAGWTSTDTTFTCSSVSTGSGCQLPLSYQPTAAGSGTLTLAYAYTDNAGAAKTGSVNIAYAATANDSVVATPNPTGQITAIAGSGTQAVTVSFTTNDGNAASALSLTTDLTALPSGWSSTAQAFTCAAVSTGNGCQLPLTFAPTTAGSGTLTLAYAYQNNAGLAKTGTLNIAYTATEHDNVTGAVLPSGQITALANGGTQAVTVTFTTDDGKSATGLSVTTSLTGLPAGWSSSASTFSCATVSTGSSCQLPLSFTPTTVGSGTLALQYGYTDDAGTAKTGTVNIAYAGTTHDNAVATVSPTGTVSTLVNGSQAVTITFTTDDGNTAGPLSVTSGLTNLPSGWSGASSFTCSSISTGSGCTLSVTYSPTAAASGTLTLNFSYADNAGTANTGSVSIPYSAILQHGYVVDSGTAVYICNIASDHTLSGCASTGGLSDPFAITFNGSFAYVSDFNYNNVYVCAVAVDGTLSNCATTGSGFDSPTRMSIDGSYFYVGNANGSGNITYCTINSLTGALSNCASSTSLGQLADVTTNGNLAYATGWYGSINLCTVTSGGSLSNCAVTASSLSSGNLQVALSTDGYAYIVDATLGVSGCTVNNDGTLTACTTAIFNNDFVLSIALSGSYAYVAASNTTTYADDVYLCTASAGAVSNCAISDGGVTFNNVWDVVIH